MGSFTSHLSFIDTLDSSNAVTDCDDTIQVNPDSSLTIQYSSPLHPKSVIHF